MFDDLIDYIFKKDDYTNHIWLKTLIFASYFFIGFYIAANFGPTSFCIFLIVQDIAFEIWFFRKTAYAPPADTLLLMLRYTVTGAASLLIRYFIYMTVLVPMGTRLKDQPASDQYWINLTFSYFIVSVFVLAVIAALFRRKPVA